MPRNLPDPCATEEYTEDSFKGHSPVDFLPVNVISSSLTRIKREFKETEQSYDWKKCWT